VSLAVAAGPGLGAAEREQATRGQSRCRREPGRTQRVQVVVSNEGLVPLVPHCVNDSECRGLRRLRMDSVFGRNMPATWRK